VSECWKVAKKVFRRACRGCVSDVASKHIRELNALFLGKQLSSFWRKLGKKKRPVTNSCLFANDFAIAFSSVMTEDPSSLSAEQVEISQSVERALRDTPLSAVTISPDALLQHVLQLMRNSSPGPDGLSAEHLVFAHSYALLTHLSSVFSASLSVVPIHAPQAEFHRASPEKASP
jgi:hypothetical protein